jgi:MFS family permease
VTPGSGRGLLRDRDVRLVIASVGLSALGDWLALVALALQIEDMTDSAFAIAGLFICLWAPVVVLAGHVGLLVDRFETTRLLAVVSLAQVGAATALAFVESVPAILVLAALLGVGFAISQAAEFALVPAVAGADRVQAANGYVETARYVGFTAGPVCGSLLALAGGTEAAMLVNAGTFAFVACAALALRTRRPPQPHPSDLPAPRARDGITVLFADRRLALAMGVAFVSLLFMSASIPADIVYVEDVLGIEDIGLGTVYTGWTIGMIVGSLVLARRVPASALATAAFIGVAVQGLGKAVTPLWLVFWFMVVGYVVGGMGHGLKNVCFRTLIHREVPEHVHGRAFAAYNGLRNAAELGALALGGLLVTVLGARETLWVAGGISALAGLAGLVLLRGGALRPRLRPQEVVESPASTIRSP